MKKRIAGVTAAMMVVAAIAAPAVFAEETEAGLGLVNTSDEPVVFDYHDVDDSVFEGQWWDTGLGFDRFLQKLNSVGLVVLNGKYANVSFEGVHQNFKSLNNTLSALQEQAVVCGGTGLYINALTRPLSFSERSDEKLHGFLFG